MYGCGKDCLILIPFRLPQISCFTLGLKCFSSDSDSCPTVGIRPLLQFPHPSRAGPVPLTLLFFPLVPLSYRVLPGSIHSLPLIRYSCLFLTGVLCAVLCLKAHPWSICGERDAPRSPTPLPSRSSPSHNFMSHCFHVQRVPTIGCMDIYNWELHAVTEAVKILE